MTEDHADRKHSAPTPAEMREQVRVTREELGHTVEALAAKADVKGQARAKAAEVKSQIQARTAQVRSQVHDAAAHVVETAHDKTPGPVRETAAQTRDQLTASASAVAAKVQENTPEQAREKGRIIAVVARRHRTALITAGVVFTLALLRRARRRNR
ncbi:DUF3618 domain-containing protein [Streptomyces sp. NPDC002044]|uniref:DUF3618 domain-containing protein n=1 Tax=Streptomyces sp. NPDC002044 TaxID=3154662 RepID=UPI00332EC9B8